MFVLVLSEKRNTAVRLHLSSKPLTLKHAIVTSILNTKKK